MKPSTSASPTRTRKTWRLDRRIVRGLLVLGFVAIWWAGVIGIAITIGRVLWTRELSSLQQCERDCTARLDRSVYAIDGCIETVVAAHELLGHCTGITSVVMDPQTIHVMPAWENSGAHQ